MGIDVTLFAERRTASCWVHMPCPPEADPEGVALGFPPEWYWARNRDLFERLGLVSASGARPIAEPRGLPADVSDETRAAYNEEETGSTSWFAVDELLGLQWEEEFGGFVEAMNRIAIAAGGADAARIVFWFA